MQYLDHAATSPMRPEATAAMREALDAFGNPSSLHRYGQQAKSRVEAARAEIAVSLGAEAVEVVLTSGGTEAINLALVGRFCATGSDRNVIVVPEGEHHAVLDTVEWLERVHGAQIAWVPLTRGGRIDEAAWTRALDEHAGRIALATAIWVNNETGTIQPVDALADLTGRAGIALHLDAVAAYGHERIDFAALQTRNPDTLVSVSAHKIGGPQGVGALLVPRTTSLEAHLHGGGQQRKLRAG
ncbi:MAG TPA: aminotransferase class V-fold PLP-dependent enzyme, partial [Microbacteriaceae bacterium]|nr:aminotransferase class V-fold PLP-dependent enzyme [Microbacteriaceae bacterium]